MKILFVIRSTRTFHYHKSIIQALLDRGHTVRALFDYEWSKTKIGSMEIIEEFRKQHPGFEFGWALQRIDLWSRVLFPVREILSYRRYLMIPEQSSYYRDRWLKYTPFWFRFALRFVPGFSWGLRSDISEQLMRWIEHFAPADAAILAELTRERYDGVVASPANLRYSSADLEYLKAARKLNIPTAVQVISWDNLTTKGVFHIISDIVLVWNKTQAEEAVRHHRIPRERIKIVGAAVFDEWFSHLAPSCSRKEFCDVHGFDPAFPILMYLGSTKNIAKDESWLVENIRKALNASSDVRIRQTQILVRPHPANVGIYQRIESKNIVIVPKLGSLPNSRTALQLFYDSAYYAVGTIGINTSGMIDALLAGKPGIAYRTDIYAKTQAEAEHFQYLVKNRAVEIVNSNEEFLKVYAGWMNSLDERKVDRDCFIKTYIRPRGIRISAGDAAATEIEACIMKNL